MSARFGRNQRRALRAELAAAHLATIAETARRLFGCAPAPIGTPEVERWGIVTWSLSIDDDRRQVERKASVLVEDGTAVIRAHRADGYVSFQGGLYRIAEVRYSEMSGGGYFGARTWRGGPDAFYVDLVGVER